MATPQQSHPGKPQKTSSYGAGSEGWDGTEDPSSPVTSADSGSEDASGLQDAARQDQGTQSDYNLSDGDEGRFRVAEEVSTDMQSDDARRVGQMPPEINASGVGANPAEAMGDAMLQPDGEEKEALRKSINRAVPPSV
ncbi:hypothetical protein [Noviherbaspirillum galbum]|uniref:Uncharacterized protein n=1 Tax=Noviherbaspirillum galbum TaxID=2709383 RepID=A0A6B3SRY4_9BURK|nr:hypothetical protein [Noviherbaspirillum galbum]NEX63278.1 hypothetical protein [Noviherbaspirillum galbum]